MIGTFVLVLVATMLKEGYEDFQRYKSDKELNNKLTLRFDYTSKQWETKKWSEIRQGDLVRVKSGEEIPADLLIVDAPKDTVYVSTMNLDGETNLKERELAIKTLNDKGAKFASFRGMIECDTPNESLDEWNGSLCPTKDHDPLLAQTVPCDIKNIILRGMTLRNTPYCVGIVCYVGAKTKIFMNSKKAIRKVSNLMKLMNKMLYSVFAF
jgi:magnesium-transporting ATPase (P-type)